MRGEETISCQHSKPDVTAEPQVGRSWQACYTRVVHRVLQRARGIWIAATIVAILEVLASGGILEPLPPAADSSVDALGAAPSETGVRPTDRIESSLGPALADPAVTLLTVPTVRPLAPTVRTKLPPEFRLPLLRPPRPAL